MKAQNSERGQAIVLIVLAIFVIFGFAALAVDLGSTYAERRRAQNAADASALAAAFAVRDAELNKTTISETALEQKAIEKAKQNGFINVTGSDKVQVVYHHPPVSGPYTDNQEYHQVFITVTVPQSFSQLVFTGTQRLTVEAVARSRPTESITPGDALHASNNKACNAMEFDGSMTTYVTGGDVYSNSGGTGNCASGWKNGSGSLTVDGANIRVAGDWVVKGGSGSVWPTPEERVDHSDLPDVPVPDCTNLLDRTDGASMQPGVYRNGITVKGKATMAPGMYCLDDNFIVNGNGDLTGNGVFIVMRKGSVDFTGGGQINLTRASDLTDGSGQQWGGMLIYMLSSNHGGIDLSGGGNTTYTGTVFAPGPRDSNKSKCTVGGNSGSIGLSANIICDTVKIHGTANITVNFIEPQNYRMPPLVELSQ